MNSKITQMEKNGYSLFSTKSFLVLFLLTFLSQFSFATVYTFNGGANWNTGANWTNGIPPNPLTTGNSIIINSNCALNIGAATQTINNGASITINAGVTLTVNTGKTLSIDGSMSNAGTSTTAGTGALAFTANGVYNHTQNGGTIPTATWNATSTCNVTGITNTVPAGIGQSFGNFTWNCTGQTGSVGLNSAMSIQGDFTITSTGATSNLRLTDNATARALAIGGDFIQTGGIFRVNNNTGAGTMNVTGNFSLSGTADMAIVSGNALSVVSVTGNVSITAGTLRMSEDAQPGTLNVGGDFTFTGGTISQITSAGEIVFNKTGTQTYTSGGTLSGQINFTVNSGSILQMGTGAAPGIISGGSTGTFDLLSGGTLGVTSTVGITTTGATGNIQVTGVRTYAAGSHLIYNGNANQAVGNGLTSTNKANITINNPGNTVTLGTNTTITGILTVTAGSTLALSTSNLGSPSSTVLENGATASTISGSGTLTLGGGVTVNYTSGSGAGASISCPVSLGATRTFTVADETSTTTDLTISGLVSGATFGVTKVGAGAMLLSNSNNFTGAVTITTGTLIANTIANSASNSSLGTGGGTPAISIAAAGILQYTGSGHSTNRAITLTGSGATVDASGSGTMTLTGGVSGAFNLVLTGTGVGSQSGVIATTGGTLTKNGTGTWILSGNNTYTGATTISTGTIQLSGASERIANSSALTVNGIFDLNGFSETVTSLAGSGTITSSATGALTFSQGGTTSTAFSGIIQNGSATSVGFSKSGTGTITFSGANTYSGATALSGGTVQLGAADVIPDNSAITFTTGTLSTGSGAGFSETIGTINLASTGTISLGTGTHTLTIANSSGVTWAGTTLTINGWTGTGVGSSITASAGKIVVGVGGLTSAQLLKVTFTGFAAGAAISASGELIPTIPIFYSKSSSAPNTAANWNTKRDGTGTDAAAGDFTNGSVFVIQGTGNGGTTPHTMTTSATWSISGTNSAVVIENGGVLVSPFAITLATATTFQIDNGGTYKHQNTTAWATTIFQGTESFGNSSTIEINATNATLPTNSSYGNLIINLTTDPGAAISFAGNLTTINGSLTVQNTLSREVRLASASAPTITIAQDLSISGATSSFTITSGAGGPTVAVAGDFSMTGGTFSMSGSTGAGKLTIAGNYSHTGGTITETSTGSGTITFVGTGTQTFTSGGTLANTINYAINSGATVDFGTSVISSGSGGTFTLNSGGKIITANNAGLTTSGATGTVQSTGGRTYNSGASYEFQGSNTGAFTLSTGNTVNGTGVLTFNRSAGVTIDQNFIATTLALTSGAVTTNALSITIASGGTYTGGSSTAYVSGILKRVFPSATTLVFPIGKGGNYRPLTFQYTSLTGTSTVTAQQTESALTGSLPASTNLNNSRTWDISQTGGSAFNYKVTLDATGDNVTGTVVMLKKEAAVITSNAATAASPNYTNTTGFTTMSGTVNFTTGSTCTVSANAGTDQTSSATCGLTSVSLSGNTPSFGTGQWSVVSGAGGSFSGGSGNPTNSNIINPTFSGTAGTAYNLQWTISNGNCSANDQVLVTLNQNPTTANAGPDQTGISTCGLTTVSLAGNSPTVGTGQWSIISGSGGSFSGGSGNPSNSSINNPTFSGTAGTAYTLRWTTSNSPCTSSTDDVLITFNQNPTTANAGPDQTSIATCGLTTVSLSANSPSVGTGQWSIVSGSGGSFSGGSGNPSNSNSINPTFSGTAGTSYTLRWSISNSPCNTSTDDVVITFNQNPTTANAGPDQIDILTCGLTTVTLAGNSPTVGTGQWSIISGTGGSFSGGSGNPSNSNSNNPTFSGTAGSSYTLRWTISNSPCTSSSDDVVITFNQNPSTANAGPDQTSIATCGLTTVSLSANSPSVGTGQWSIVSGSGGSFSGGAGNPSNSNSINPTFSGTAGTSYTLRWSITNSPCTSSTDDVVITFNQNPTTANAGPDQTGISTCGLTTVTLAGNSPTVGTGQWSVISGSGGSFSGGSGNPSNSSVNNPTFSGTAGSTYTLRWSISNSPCTSSADDVVITFNQNPTTANAGPDQTNSSTCGLTTLTLAGNTVITGAGQWTIISGSGGSFIGGSGNPSTSDLENADFNGVAGTTYVLRWTISNLCGSSSDDVAITLNESPTVADAGPDQTDVLTCGQTSVVLAANTPITGTGSWSVVSGAGGSFSNSSSETSTFIGTAGTSYVLRWTIANSPCTASTDDVNITFNLEPTTSNAGSNQSFCGGSFIVLSANTPTIGTGAWSILGGPSMNLSQFSSLSDPNATFTEDGGLGSYTLEWTITNAPCVSSSSVIVTAIAGPWIGGVSTDWYDAANWCGGIPTATTDVAITSGATFYPVITTGSILVQSITIDAGGSLTVDGGDIESGPITNDGTLTVGVGGTLNLISNQVNGAGDVFINGTVLSSKAAGFSGTTNTAIRNTITTLVLGSASTIDYTSGGSQTISAINYANVSNSGNGNRTLSSSGTIGISANFDPGTGDYTITNSTVEFNGTAPQNAPALAPDSKYNNLVINNSTGVSMIADLNLEDALTLTNGAFTTTGFNFTLLSSATKTARIATITGGSIVGDVTMQRFVPGGNAGWATIGMPVSGRTLADWDDDIITTGFNGSSTGSGTFVNIYTYDETVAGGADTAAAYIPATDITNSVDPKVGYFVFIADNATTVTDKLLDVSGPPLTGSQNMNVTYTNNVNSDEDGWNLISNPYCSSIDWTSPDWTKTNMDDAIYIYDADNLQYTGYVSGASFNGGNEIIGSTQAFLVHANASSPSLIAEETVKDATSPTFYKSSSTTIAAGFLRLQLDGLGGTYHDETILRTKAGATFNFDPAYDAYKLLSFDYGAPNISTKLNGKSYVVNSIDELTGNLDLDVKVIVNTPGSYTINFKGLNNFANVNCLTFEDKMLGTFLDLHADSSYTFNSAIDTAAAYNRFVLHFGIDALTASILPSATNISIPGNGIVNFTNTSTGASAYTWDFGDGSSVETGISPSHTFTAAGVYTVTLTASNKAGCSGPQTSTVVITVDDVTATINQVAAEQISISKDAQGVYANYNFKNSTEVKVNVYNSIGELVSNSQQVKVQNKGKFLIETKQLAKGIYSIEMLVNDRKIVKKIDL